MSTCGKVRFSRQNSREFLTDKSIIRPGTVMTHDFCFGYVRPFAFGSSLMPWLHFFSYCISYFISLTDHNKSASRAVMLHVLGFCKPGRLIPTLTKKNHRSNDVHRVVLSNEIEASAASKKRRWWTIRMMLFKKGVLLECFSRHYLLEKNISKRQWVFKDAVDVSCSNQFFHFRTKPPFITSPFQNPYANCARPFNGLSNVMP